MSADLLTLVTTHKALKQHVVSHLQIFANAATFGQTKQLPTHLYCSIYSMVPYLWHCCHWVK